MAGRAALGTCEGDLHVDGERVKLRIDVVHEQPRGARAPSLGVFDVLATEVD